MGVKLGEPVPSTSARRQLAAEVSPKQSGFRDVGLAGDARACGDDRVVRCAWRRGGAVDRLRPAPLPSRCGAPIDAVIFFAYAACASAAIERS